MNTLVPGANILVTGATGGIGGAAARACASAGAHVIATGRRSDALEACLQRLPGDGHTCFAADLRSEDDVAALVARTPELAGLVHAAGSLQLAPFRAMPATRWDAQMEADLGGPVRLVRHLLRAGRIREGASLVFVTSIAARRGTLGHAAYAAAKAAVEGWARSLAIELAPRRVRVNCVAPGWVDTELSRGVARQIGDEAVAGHLASYPLGAGTTEDVAGAIVFLLGSGARWITGQTLAVDGGLSAS